MFVHDRIYSLRYFIIIPQDAEPSAIEINMWTTAQAARVEVEPDKKRWRYIFSKIRFGEEETDVIVSRSVVLEREPTI